MSDDEQAVPEFIPTVSRTTSDEFTRPMYMIDHRCAKIDGPPDLPNDFEDEDTLVDAIVVDVEPCSRI